MTTNTSRAPGWRMVTVVVMVLEVLMVLVTVLMMMVVVMLIVTEMVLVMVVVMTFVPSFSGARMATDVAASLPGVVA